MTTNERVIEFMGWKKYYGKHYWCWRDSNDDTVYGEAEINFNDIDIAKLLQAKMVADGWTIIAVWSDVGVTFSATKQPAGFPNYILKPMMDESAALYELFLKVYDIEEG